MRRTSRAGLEFDRLRVGEWTVGVAGLALLIDLIVVPWYSLRATFRATSAGLGAATSATGFQAHDVLGPLAVICGLLAVAVWCLQATQRAPALPVCVTVLCVTVGLVLAIGLLIRVVFDPPNPLVHGAPGVDTIQTDVGAVVGFLLAWVVVIGAWISLRTDGIAAADAPAKIETLALKPRSTERSGTAQPARGELS